MILVARLCRKEIPDTFFRAATEGSGMTLVIMLQIFNKEINSYLNSLIAYVVVAVFLTGMGLLMWLFPETSVLDYGFAEMTTLFLAGALRVSVSHSGHHHAQFR